jgi:hypothetical protein
MGGPALWPWYYGTGQLHYEWSFNGNIVAGATDGGGPDESAGNADRRTCAHDDVGSRLSQPASLFVVEPP